jgi:hypothetical protein
MGTQSPAGGSLHHPEWVAGRRLWMDSAMRDLIHKIHHGDPVKGWEGDPMLAVYYDGSERRWELWRFEDDGEYRMTMRSAPDAVFDDRVIDVLLERDRRRRRLSLHDEIVAHNESLDATRAARHEEWVREDIGPRLRHAIERD